jgi:hypothetical protein
LIVEIGITEQEITTKKEKEDSVLNSSNHCLKILVDSDNT